MADTEGKSITQRLFDEVVFMFLITKAYVRTSLDAIQFFKVHTVWADTNLVVDRYPLSFEVD